MKWKKRWSENLSNYQEQKQDNIENAAAGYNNEMKKAPRVKMPQLTRPICSEGRRVVQKSNIWYKHRISL